MRRSRTGSAVDTTSGSLSAASHRVPSADAVEGRHGSAQKPVFSSLALPKNVNTWPTENDTDMP